MLRRMLASLSLLVAVSVMAGGCASHRGSMDMSMQKPMQPVQMKSLERFVGKWSGTAEFSADTAEKMRKVMPVSDAGKPMQTTFAGGGEAVWMLDGMTLRHEGWYEVGDGQKKNYVELWTWNPSKGKYWIVALDNWGGHGQGWATPNASGDSFNVVMTGIDCHGQQSKGTGTITFSDRNTMQWRWKMTGPMGQMEMTGTSKRSG